MRGRKFPYRVEFRGTDVSWQLRGAIERGKQFIIPEAVFCQWAGEGKESCRKISAIFWQGCEHKDCAGFFDGADYSEHPGVIRKC